MIRSFDRTGARSTTSNGYWPALVRWFVVASFVALPSTFSHDGLAQGDATPTVDLATQLGFSAGIVLNTFAEANSVELPASPRLIRLEQISVQPNAEIAMAKTRGPELLAVQSGEVIAADSIGFQTTVAAGNSVLFRSGYGYVLKNEQADPAVLLKMSIQSLSADSSTEDVADQNAIGEPPTILFEGELSDDFPRGLVTLFLGNMQWEPGAETGSYWQDGLFGIMLETGQVTLLSPSGLEIPLATSVMQTVPARIIHEETNRGSEPASALVFAIVEAAGSIVSFGEMDTATPTAVQGTPDADG